MKKVPVNFKRIYRLVLLNLSRNSLFCSEIRCLLAKCGGVNINKKFVYIGSNVYFDTINPQRIHILGNATITSGTKILTHYFNSQSREFDIGDVYINNNVFIGVNTLIVKPVVIGENSIIAAGSVVTRNIPSNEVWGGVPAKFLKKI